MSSGQQNLLKPSDLCRKLRLSQETIDKMIESGRLPKPIQLGERSRRWREEDINQWISDGCPRQPEADEVTK